MKLPTLLALAAFMVAAANAVALTSTTDPTPTSSAPTVAKPDADDAGRPHKHHKHHKHHHKKGEEAEERRAEAKKTGAGDDDAAKPKVKPAATA